MLCLIVFYFFYDTLAKLLSVFGACASLILVYTFPVMVKMINYYLKKKENYDEENNNKCKLNYKDILFYTAYFLLIILGFANVVFQFVPINFFGINIKE